MDDDDMMDMISGYGSRRIDTSDVNVKKIRDRIEQLEKVSKMAKTIFDMMNGKLKDVRNLGDYKIYNQVFGMIKSMDTRMRDVAYSMAEEKAELETVLDAKRNESAIMATASMKARRGHRKKQQKVRLVAHPRILKNIKKYT